jgi:predicted RNase H-like HicB family nuclease
VKRVDWSEEDGCFIGSAPPLIGPSCHGATEAEVRTQLDQIVEEWVTELLTRGEPLPEGSGARD